jgi:hypothetical protein
MFLGHNPPLVLVMTTSAPGSMIEIPAGCAEYDPLSSIVLVQFTAVTKEFQIIILAPAEANGLTVLFVQLAALVNASELSAL